MMAIKRGSSYRDYPEREKLDSTKKFEEELDMEIRIADLERLVRDIWAAYSERADASFHPAWEVDCTLSERMTALGIGDAE